MLHGPPDSSLIATGEPARRSRTRVLKYSRTRVVTGGHAAGSCLSRSSLPAKTYVSDCVSPCRAPEALQRVTDQPGPTATATARKSLPDPSDWRPHLSETQRRRTPPPRTAACPLPQSMSKHNSRRRIALVRELRTPRSFASLSLDESLVPIARISLAANFGLRTGVTISAATGAWSSASEKGIS